MPRRASIAAPVFAVLAAGAVCACAPAIYTRSVFVSPPAGNWAASRDRTERRVEVELSEHGYAIARGVTPREPWRGRYDRGLAVIARRYTDHSWDEISVTYVSRIPWEQVEGPGLGGSQFVVHVRRRGADGSLAPATAHARADADRVIAMLRREFR